MQSDMLAKARARMEAQVFSATSLKEVRDFYAAEKQGAMKLDYALVKDSEEFAVIAKEYSIAPRCIPFADDGKKVIVAKAY
jgi:hypothetical protein